MADKQPKSRLPSVRALDVLKSRYIKQIDAKTNRAEKDSLERTIIETKEQEYKKLLEYLRSCLKDFETPFQEIKDKCSWDRTSISGDKLQFVLMFYPDKHTASHNAKKQIEQIEKKRESERNRLEDWYEKSLLKITNRQSTIEPFIVEE